jgi:hypothetical protein
MREDKMGNVHTDDLASIWHSPIHKQLNVLALTERCPGCLAACSDVETANQAASAGTPAAFVTAPTGPDQVQA